MLDKKKMKRLDIYAELNKTYDFLVNEWYNVAFIGVYGSQNYGLDIYTDEYTSDMDYKAVIIPTLKDLVNNSKPKSTTIEHKGGQIELKDIRVFTEVLCKCNPSYIETLYTPYSLYTEDYKKIIDERENIVKEMWIFLLKASYGMIKQKEKAFSHPYPSTKDKIDKYWYDPKQLHHIYRLYQLMKYFARTQVFMLDNEEAIKDILIDIKLWKKDLKEAENIRDKYVWHAKRVIENYTIEPKFEAKERIIQYSKDLIYNNIVKWLK